mmetsp:Transcript_2380/g.7119  ORF Transcript_2380/g.7119 Transcript_2380/m.7119 type:complete len:90 (-) Transcript_2380:327-596(-)
MTEKCFSKCVSTKGSGQLERSEQMCLGNCIDRYVDCMSVRCRRSARSLPAGRQPGPRPAPAESVMRDPPHLRACLLACWREAFFFAHHF